MSPVDLLFYVCVGLIGSLPALIIQALILFIDWRMR